MVFTVINLHQRKISKTANCKLMLIWVVRFYASLSSYLPGSVLLFIGSIVKFEVNSVYKINNYSFMIVHGYIPWSWILYLCV